MKVQQNNLHRVCTVTVMDTSDPDIQFDEDGASNYVAEFAAFRAGLPDPETRDQMLAAQLAAIKAAGSGNRYDCVLGVSGGVDSSYMAYLTKQWGLRPLVVHFDNGWNTELAVNNIEGLVTRLGFDLETYVVDWAAFRNLQRAYLKASVLDLEIPTDHLIFAALHRIAAQNGISIILSGHNAATEWLLPKAWYFSKFDQRNIVDINAKHGDGSLKKLPRLGVWQQGYYHHFRGIRTVQPLQLIEYDKAKAKVFLMQEMGWRDYGGKHHESIFTRFYQGYILPRKFGIDKRKAHLSNLILMGQLTREEALRELQSPPYSLEQQQEDKLYVAKKLGFSEAEFEALLDAPPRSHLDYRTDAKDRELYFKLARTWGRMRKIVGVKKRKRHLDEG